MAASRGTSSTTKATSATPATTKRKSGKDASPCTHRSSSRRAIVVSVMFRTLFKRAIKAVADGDDPQCVARTDDDALVRLQAGNFLVEPEAVSAR